MGLKKGQTNNRRGRPAGVPNKVTKTVREALKDIIQAETKNLPKICKEMTPYERGTFFLKLLEYVVPKADEKTAETESKPMSEWQLNFVKNQIATVDKNGKIKRVFK